MYRIFSLFFLVFFFAYQAKAQFVDGNVIRYGNEWIDYAQTYYKINLAEDGVYRIYKSDLANAGFPLETQTMAEFSMYHLGEEIQIYTSTEGMMGDSDFIEFFASKNRNELDRYLFEDQENQLNPYYSLITDTTAFFLSYGVGDHLRYGSQQTDLTGNTLEPEAYFMDVSEMVFSDIGLKSIISDQTVRSDFSKREGFSSVQKVNSDANLSLKNIYPNGPLPSLHLRLGGNNNDHVADVKINTQLYESFTFGKFDLLDTEFTFPSSELLNTTKIRVTASGNSDRLTIARAAITYPRAWNFSGEQNYRWMIPPGENDHYIEVQNFADNSENPILYNRSLGLRIHPIVEGGLVKLLLPSSPSALHYELVKDSGIKQVASIQAIEFTDFANQDYDYIIISHESIINAGNGNSDWLQSYADFRSSATGGHYNPIIVDIQDLYDQFTYGINGHFLCMKNFVHYIEPSWNNLEYIFIVGRAYEYNTLRVKSEVAGKSLVPTFGFPGSDNLLFSDWGENLPKYAVGRLAARNAEDVRIYLDKVKKHASNMANAQTVEERLWMKRIIHLSGGGAQQIESIRSYLRSMEDIIEDSKMGAEVTTYYKNSSDPVENAQSESISTLINNGLSMITFFGHSATHVLDFNLENVKNYNNSPRFPVMVSLGCYSGNVHAEGYGLSHEFVQEEDKGTIAFIGTSYQAGDISLSRFGRKLYGLVGGDFYGKTFGKTLLATLEQETLGDYFEQQMTLHGDPAIPLHVADGPDYIPLHNSISTTPNIINAYQENFEICVDVANIGRYDQQALDIRLQHYGPDEKIALDSIFVISAPSFVEQYCFILPLNSDKIVGKNRIKITVDSKGLIEELPDPAAEMNNSLLSSTGQDYYEFYVLNNGAVPVMPKEFSIVTNPEVTLMASTYNALAAPEEYMIEFDSTNTFNSPFLTKKLIPAGQGIITWQIEQALIPGKVYYWRISPNANSTGIGLVWNEASFIYLPESSPGFNQSEMGQFIKNETETLDVLKQGFEYISNYKDFRILNLVPDDPDLPRFFFNNSYWSQAYYLNHKPSIAITVLDSLGRFLMNPAEGHYGSENPGGKEIITHYFDIATEQSRIDLVNFLKDVVDETDYVFLYTKHKNFSDNFYTEEWANDSIANGGLNLFNYLESQGATEINYYRDHTITPYAFIYQKDFAFIDEERAETLTDSIESNAAVFGRWFEGKIVSPKIGPASQWSSIEWLEKTADFSDTDSTWLDVYGYNLAGKRILLLEHTDAKFIALEGLVSADTMPYLQLEYSSQDDLEQTAVDLAHWRVLFEGQAELALETGEGYIFEADTLNQGADFVLVIPVLNISSFDITDSIRVKVTIVDQSNKQDVHYFKIAGIESGGQSLIDFRLPTAKLNGQYNVSVELNDNRMPTECFYFNNLGLVDFFLKRDIRNPLLDVSFDGRRILDGDIVSSEPLINIQVKDENEYFLLNDTAAYKISLLYPNQNKEQIALSDQRITFIPAVDASDNSAQIMFQPKLLTDGEYVLEVLAEDRSGNQSGDQSYRVHFQVINEELISNVFNYPNPFSTCTQFVFTMTGNEMPEDFKIQIMTVTGKVVKEIYKDELGPLHIGVNRTEYQWCGTDDFGSKLANGVYLYRIQVNKVGGESYDKYDTNTDQFFKHNLGKLVIMR